MSEKKPKPHKSGRVTDGDQASSYTVGRGRPPEHTRFKKGESGNPGGRPRGSKNLKTLIYEMAEEHISINTPEGRKLVTLREALARKVWDMQLKGEYRFIQAYHTLEQEKEKELNLGSDGRRDELLLMQKLLYKALTGDPDAEEDDDDPLVL